MCRHDRMAQLNRLRSEQATRAKGKGIIMFARIREYLREAFAEARLRHELSTLLPAPKLNEFLNQFQLISRQVNCPHNPSHILTFVNALLKIPKDVPGVIIEAGCFKGGSTAKFSLIAKYLGRELVVFDSFEGLPDNDENHEQTISGTSIKDWFKGKEFCGALDEVKNNVSRFGDPSVCRYVKGWFENTLPGFDEKICAAYLDVDLASSTRTCLQHIYPKLSKKGVIVSQDGDFPLVIDVFKDDEFWQKTVGCEKPAIDGLGSEKMLTIVKP